MSTLLASPQTVQALAGARAVVALVGGYDGAGNFGDLALVAAARDLAERLGPGVLALAVVDEAHADAHRARDPGPALIFGRPTRELVPVAAPAAPCGLYLYGGGYLNAQFGPRRLEMAAAAEHQLGASTRISSGLQADPDWVLGQHVLARFAPLGVRDARSAQGLADAVCTGDDAVAVLPAASGAGPEARVNVHVADHPWTTDDPEAVQRLWLAALAAAEAPLVVQPVIAYDDTSTSDRPALARFSRRCTELGHEVAEPVLLQPGVLDEAAAVLERATFSLSCSFHVALMTLLLGVPTALASANAYYEQKAAGLRDDFRLPAFCAPADEVAAAAFAAYAQDPQTRPELRERALEVRARRVRAEGDLLARLGAGLLADATERLAERGSEAVRLRSELAQLRLELQATQRESTNPLLPADARLAVEQAGVRAEESRAARASEQLRRRAAEARIAELEGTIASLERQLGIVYGSRSWKLTKPLRATRSERRGSTL